MNARHCAAFFVSCSVMGIAWNVASRAQNPHAVSSVAAVPDSAQPKRRNLQVLPISMSDADVIQVMVRYGQELGVQCGFCHAEDSQTQQLDFASDENPRKQTARIMIGMLGDINNKYLAQVGDRRYAVPISCGNCHQGQTYPPPFQAKSPP
jgi:photosynthetic reaction center cytochrome c subunit